MSPTKKKKIEGHKVEQYYWAGRHIVYLNDRLVHYSFDGITAKNVNEIHKSLIAKSIAKTTE